jgi:hypothetical protein
MTAAAYTLAERRLYYTLVEIIRTATVPEVLQKAWEDLESLKNKHAGHIPDKEEQ